MEVPEHYNKLGIPQKLVDIAVAAIPVSGGGQRQLQVPVTKEVLKHTSSGYADYVFWAVFGNQEATSEESLPVAPAPGNDAHFTVGMPRVTFTPYEAAVAPAAPGTPHCICPTCILEAVGKQFESSNLIGQMQSAAGKGSEADYEYKSEADSTFGVGVSLDYKSHYHLDGHFHITNSISDDGGSHAGPSFNRFIYGHFYRQRYENSETNPNGKPACGYQWKIKFVSAVGDVYEAGKKVKRPALDPWGRCANDPYGLAEMDPSGGHYGTDRGNATDYDASASIYNLTVDGQTGYTNDIHIEYTNNSKLSEYVCGNNFLPNAPILWSNNDAGR
jgi:hypothetical protein